MLNTPYIPHEKKVETVLKLIIIGDAAVGKSSLIERYTNDCYKYCSTYSSTIGIDFKIRTVIVPYTLHPTLYPTLYPTLLSKIKSHPDDVKVKKSQEYDTGCCSYDNIRCKLYIWDTAGQERFKSIAQAYYKGTEICIICFDASSTIIDNTSSDDLSSDIIVATYNKVDSWIKTMINDTRSELDKLTTTRMIYIIGTKIDMYNDTTDDSDDDNEINDDSMANNIYYQNHGQNMAKYIKLWESYQNVKFIGWCSSKSNQYIPCNISSNISEQMYDIPLNDSEITHTDKCARNRYTICDMFNMLLSDYVSNNKNLLRNKKMIHEINNHNINISVDDRKFAPDRCCVIL
jgi:small GTP-binding protein